MLGSLEKGILMPQDLLWSNFLTYNSHNDKNWNFDEVKCEILKKIAKVC